MHGGDRLGPDAGTGGRADAADRRGALRRARDRHRALHVREHQAARAPDGRRADRGRGRRAGDLPPALRGGAAREARRCSAARSRSIAALRRRRADGRGAERRGLPGDAGARTATRRASSTTCARSHGTKVAVLVREADGTRAPRRAQGLAARDRRRRRRVGDRARAGRRRPPPRRGVLDDARARGADRVPAPRDRGAAAPGARRAKPPSAARRREQDPARAADRMRPCTIGRSCSSTSRRASPRTTSSPRCGARWAASSRPRRARSTRSRPAC